MQRPILAGIPDSFWQRAAAARHRLLTLEYDGALVPGHAARRDARPVQPTLEAIRRIASLPDTTLCIVSDRPARDLATLLGGAGATLVGESGWEQMSPGGALTRHALPPEQSASLRRAALEAAVRGWGSHLERRRASLRLHACEALPEVRAGLIRDCLDLWSRHRTAGLRLTEVDGDLELASPGRDRGTAVLGILAGNPVGTFPVHVGDEATDEEIFRVIHGHGYGISVGGEARSIGAPGRLESWVDLPLFLRLWLLLVEGRSPATGRPAPSAPPARRRPREAGTRRAPMIGAEAPERPTRAAPSQDPGEPIPALRRRAGSA